MKQRIIIFSGLTLLNMILLTAFVYLYQKTPLPKISGQQAVNIALAALEADAKNKGLDTPVIKEIRGSELDIWFHENGQEVLRYHIPIKLIVNDDPEIIAAVSIDVNATSGEVYDVENNPLQRNKENNGTYDYILNRTKNKLLNLKLLIWK